MTLGDVGHISYVNTHTKIMEMIQICQKKKKWLTNLWSKMTNIGNEWEMRKNNGCMKWLYFYLAYTSSYFFMYLANEDTLNKAILLTALSIFNV